jgi:response regulator RpfG family c-di-GMP phosphodiesterase
LTHVVISGSGSQTENTVTTENSLMNLLFISDSDEKADLLRQAMRQQGLRGDIRRMRPTRSAVAYARRSGRFKEAKAHDFILFDFSEPDEKCLSIVADVAFGPNKAASPVILLTSPGSECLLDSERLAVDDHGMFAPTSLSCFLNKMRQHSRSRFMRALTVMSDLGPVLVRLPGFFMRHRDDVVVQQVA